MRNAFRALFPAPSTEDVLLGGQDAAGRTVPTSSTCGPCAACPSPWSSQQRRDSCLTTDTKGFWIKWLKRYPPTPR